MSELQDYQHRRLELGDQVRAVLHIARRYRDREAELQARQLLSRLAGDHFAVAVTGQFSRGKSTLMNALLGGAYLPTGSVPTTSVVTSVRYGSHPRAVIRRRGSSLPTEVPLRDVSRFVSQTSAERAELQVASVELEVPAELLRLGFEFADTPEVGSTLAANTAVTTRFLAKADAVVFVTGFDSPLIEAEAGLLADVLRLGRELFLVINKADLVSAEEAAEVTDFVQQWVAEHHHGGQPRMFALSALEGVRAAGRDDTERLTRSGVPAFRSALTEFLTTEKAHASLRNIATAAASLVRGQQRGLRVGQLAADGRIDADAISADFETGLQDLLARERSVTGDMADHIREKLPDLLRQRDPRWQADLREKLGSAVEALDLDGAEGTSTSSQHHLDRTGRDIAGDWLARRAGEVHELITGITAGDIDLLLAFAASIRAMGTRMAGLPVMPEPSAIGWSAEDIPPTRVPAVPWAIRVTPPRRRGRRSPSHTDRIPLWLADAISEGASRFANQTQEALLEAAQAWAEQLRIEAERATAEAAEQFLRYLRTPPRAEDIAAVEDLVALLADFQAAVDTGAHDHHDEIRVPSPEPDGTERSTARSRGCQICHGMEEVLADRLRHDQFRLATQSADQAAHADSGGFCPLHTWQYAMLASPLGISAGSARLADSVADSLDSIAGNTGTVGEFFQATASLSQSGACSICAALAGHESRTVAELATQPEDAGEAALCLRHASLVLGGLRSPVTGQAILRRLSQALRRGSEDMRSYAMKREALQNSLVTREESHAHEEVLRLLAGHPSLTVAPDPAVVSRSEPSRQGTN
ncbi:MAG TPA: dynamin family protein [Trebonia sp.]|nr:dynamin family protein [Trebonia sp.]